MTRNKETLKAQLYEAAAQLLEDIGYSAEYREDYSGRGMYGQTTVAIVTGATGSKVAWALCKVSLDLDEEENFDLDDTYNILPNNVDSMGQDKVYY